MDISIAQPGGPYDSITSPLLRSAIFEKLDKSDFVKSFVESQKHHATSYADGQSILAIWDGQTSDTPKKQKPSGSLVRDFGFDTPVLKPRVARPPIYSTGKILDTGVNEDEEKEKKLCLTKSSRPEKKLKKKPVVEPTSKSNKENVRHPPSISKGKKSSKKRVILADSDDEYVARLTERRDRKRAKREIVQPDESTVPENEDDQDDEHGFFLPKRKVGKGKKDKKSKVPAAFALMHGFTATNVGKNRLTLKPGPSVGVFGKGKASAKTRVLTKKTVTKNGPIDNMFSELAFLNKNRKDSQIITPVRPTSSSSQSENSSSSASSPPKKILITNRESLKSKQSVKLSAKRRDPQTSVGVRASEAQSVVAEKSKDADAKSELWNIELEDYRSIPDTQISPAVAWDDHLPQGTVVMNTLAIWPDAYVDGTMDNKRLEGGQRDKSHDYPNEARLSSCCEHAELGRHHSSSICPSESASQYGQPRVLRSYPNDASSHQAISKYFMGTGAQVASMAAEEAPLPTHQAAKEFSEPGMHSSAVSLVHPNDAFLMADDRNHSMAIPNNHHNSKKTVACPSSVDSIEMELRDHRDTLHTHGTRRMSEKQTDEILGAENDVYNFDYNFDFDYESCMGVQEIYLRDSQDDMSELEMKDEYAYYNQQIGSPMLDEYGGMNAEQDVIPDGNAFVVGNDMSGSGLYEFGMEEEAGIEDFEYVSPHDPFHEIIHYDANISCGTAYSSCQGTSAPLDDYTSDEKSVLLTERFSQGRAMLLGLSNSENHLQESSKPIRRVSHVEADVAKNLTEHWLPQRF